MTTLLTILLALLLAAYLTVCAQRWGVPDMISDTYYQGARGWFSAVMAAEAVGIACLIMRNEKLGIRNYCDVPEIFWTACGLVGCVGLLTVGLVPMYKHCRKHLWAHKAAAYVAAAGCLAWCCSVNPAPTTMCGMVLLLWCVLVGERNWLVAECLCFADVFATLLCWKTT